MALSDPEINLLRLKSRDPFDFARAIEAAARRDALEEAARVFDGEGEEAYSYHAAERIRKLKEDIQ